MLTLSLTCLPTQIVLPPMTVVAPASALPDRANNTTAAPAALRRGGQGLAARPHPGHRSALRPRSGGGGAGAGSAVPGPVQPAAAGVRGAEGQGVRGWRA